MNKENKNYFKIVDNHKVKTSELLKQCRKLFPIYCYWDNLDKEFPKPKKTTTRYFKKVVEADEELKNLSANDLKEKGIEGITLRERLIMELEYLKETGKHLDIENWTLCSGSRDSGGTVPDARWCGDRFGVGWYLPGAHGACLRSRAAVSSKSLNLPAGENYELRIKNLEEKMEKISKFLII